MLIDILIEVIIAIILFVLGIFLVDKYARVKDWETSLTKALIINIPWLIVNLALGLVYLFLAGTNIIIDFNILTFIIFGINPVMRFYKKGLKDSFLFALVIQIILYAIGKMIQIMLNVATIILTVQQLPGGPLDTEILMLFIATFTILGIMTFFTYWGDKVQLVKRKQLIALISSASGIYVLLFSFANLGDFNSTTFIYSGNFDTFFIGISLSFVIAFLANIVLKKIAYKYIPYRELREISILEKDVTLLELKDLRVYYPLLKGMLRRQVGAVKAVDGISFEIKTSETVGLVGESGCGKSTAANAILGLVEKTSGEILFHGKPVPKDYSKFIRQKIQIVFQDPDASLNPRLKVVDIIAEPLINLLGITKKSEIRSRVLELLEQVSLKREHLDRYPHEFSGGQKQRIIIARALASNPELLILDEPTSALDVSVQAQILNLLKDLQKTYGYGFLFITHNLSVVNHIADRIAVMYLGKFVEIGNTDQIFLTPTHPYTQALLASRSEIDPHNREISFVIEGEVPSPIAPPPGCTFNPRCVSDARTKECEFDLPHKIKIGEKHFIWCVNPPTSKGEKVTGFY
jgi:oligopeptide/dipeptide ABC transporter ATP-binding protein